MVRRAAMMIPCLFIISLSACTLPGASSPTPFTFPTPNLTHTAIFATTPTDTPIPPTLPPLEDSATPPLYSPTPTSATSIFTPTPTAKTAQPSQRPNGSPVTAAFLSAPPVIDGNISEWTTTVYTANQALPQAKEGWTGSDDLSATFYIGWDSSYLYLAVHRIDDKFVQISYGRYMYRGDDIEIQLDTNLPGDFSSQVLSNDDFQIGLSPGNFGTRAEEAYRWYPRVNESWLTSVKVEAVRKGEGYDLEARIPWSVFGITPAGGNAYGFAFAMSDNDLPGKSTWQSMVSNVLTRKLMNPTTWGTLLLEEPTAK